MALEGARRTSLTSRNAATVLALLLAAVFAVLAYDATERDLLDADHAVQEIAKTWRTPALDGPMRAISALGSGAVLIPLNALLAFGLWRRRYQNPLLIPALALGSVVFEALVKWLVHRPRPKAVGYGFPSGHVMGAIVVFGLVLYLLWSARHGGAVACLAVAVGVIVVAGIGVSRIYLNAHWLSDVLGAAAAGLTFLIFSILRLGSSLCERCADGGPLAPFVPAWVRVSRLRAHWTRRRSAPRSAATSASGPHMARRTDSPR
jgi:undecaprenyl-diphosphatase